MNNIVITSLLCSVALLTGCSSVEDKLINALNSGDGKDVCVNMNVLGVSMYKKQGGGQYLAQEKAETKLLPKLIEKKYVADTTESLIVGRARIYANKLTEKGRKYFKWAKNVCVGDGTATKIIEYTEPAEMGGMIITRVKFAYDIEFNKFSRELDLDEIIRDPTDDAVLAKTNKGWRVEGGW